MREFRAGLIAVAFVSSSYAADPRIPIDGPITISESGNYIVTRDFAGFPAIQFSGDSDIDVDIDFNLHTVTGQIPVRAFGEQAARKVTLRHGQLSYGGISTYLNVNNHLPEVYLDGLTLDHVNVYIEDGRLNVTSSRLMNSELVSHSHNGGATAMIAGNQLFNSNIRLHGGDGSRVFNNLIRNGSIEVGGGDLGAGFVVVASNTIVNGNISGTPDIDGANGIQVVKNRVGGYIVMDNWFRSTVQANEIGGCGGIGSAIVAERNSFRNEISNNFFLGGCAHGIEFGGTAWYNEYSGNTFRVPVPEPVIDEGEFNGPAGVDVAPE